MVSSKQKVQIAGGFATLVFLAVVVGCNGFFVDPTLTSIAVGPQATIQQNQTVQMSAVGTYNDGTTKTLSGNIFWSSSDLSVASITNAGLVTGTGIGQSTISGASGTVTGSTTVTVTVEGLTAIKIIPVSTAITAGNTQQYTATGTTNQGTVGLNGAGELNWAIDNTDSNLISIDSTGLVTTTSGIATQQIVHVTATDPTTGIVSNTATLTVNP